MKYKSEIFEVLHENAVEMYKIGGITEASMREYDEMCLVPEALHDNTTHGDIAPETVNIEHAEPQPSAEREGSPLDLATA